MQGNIRRLTLGLMGAFLAVALGLTYWQVIRAEGLVYGEFNPRLAREETEIIRGRILDRGGRELAVSHRTPEGIRRVYTNPTTSHVTGYYSARYGSSGLESAFSRYLRGDAPASPLDYVAVRMLHRPRVGADLHLTLDGALQGLAARLIGNERGAIVALEPKTGAVLAMVATPYFDANRVDEDWDKLQGDAAKPLYNRATQGLYTPGSVFKIVTATAAIDLGLVDLDKKYKDTGDLIVDGFRIANNNHDFQPTVNFVEDFAFSCNVTFAKTGLSLDTRPLPLGNDMPNPPPWAKGIDETKRRFEEYAHRFRVGEPIPFDLATSTSRLSDGPMSRLDLANTAFGQGELQVTPLMMALGVATIANSGRVPQPYLVQEVRDPDGRVLLRRSPSVMRVAMSAQTAAAMNQLMVTSAKIGYARTAQIPGIEVGGKTGSAEVGPGQKTHSWFIGYAPADDPRIAVAVIMENKGAGSDFAAPAGRDLMRAALGR